MNELAGHLRAQEGDIRTEARLQRESIETRWRQDLTDRVSSGRALGPLSIHEIEDNGLVHFDPPREDIAIFRDRDQLRLSQNDPEGDHHLVTFLGITTKGLTVHHSKPGTVSALSRTGWTLDEHFLDLSGYYLDAIDALGSTAHGRDHVSPVLFDPQPPQLDLKTYDEAADAMESGALDDSQADAVARALASSPFHLIQGPPGTGKTYALARLVEELVSWDHRVLVTAFTHRAIHQALGRIHALLGDRCPVVKISQRLPGDQLPFDTFETWGDSGLADRGGPCVVGATPFALWTKRLSGVRFDSIVLDETSQLTLPSAAMAMLRGDRWFFFGDHQQLPPVSFVHRDHPAAASVFAHLARTSKPTTLNTTYRLNEPLTSWPSENFYGGALTAHETNAAHRIALKDTPRRYPAILAPDPSLVRLELDHQGCRSRSDEEADLAADLLADLFDSGLSPDQAGVVVPFRAQASAIRRLLRGDRFTNHPPAPETVVDTVDRFQGQEREVIIFSFACSDPAFIERLETFLFQPPRLNVAVTRARTKVILLHSTMLHDHARTHAPYSEPAALFLSLLDAATPLPF